MNRKRKKKKERRKKKGDDNFSCTNGHDTERKRTELYTSHLYYLRKKKFYLSSTFVQKSFKKAININSVFYT